MRQIESVMNTKAIVIGLILSMCLLPGCGDSPENKAAKELRAKADKATEIYNISGDFDKAYKLIQSAIKQHASKAGAKADPAMLAGGNLVFNHAQRLKLNIGNQTEPASKMVDDISDAVIQLVLLQMQQTAFDGLRSVTDEEVLQLNNALSGDGQTTGIKGLLLKKNVRLEQLELQKEELKTELDVAKAQENELQHQAEEKFRLSEKSTGDEKVQLQKQAYDLLMEKSKYYMTIQKAADSIELLDGEMTVVSKLISGIEKNIDLLENRRTEMSDTDRIDALDTELAKGNEKILQQEDRIADLAATLESLLNSYNEKIEETATLFEVAADDYYKRTRGRGPAQQVSQLQLSESYAAQASLLNEDLRYHSHLATRLQSLANAAEGRTESLLNMIVSKSMQKVTQAKDKALENYDLAIEGYKNLRTSIRGDADASCLMAKSQVLALYGKMALADFVGEYDIADQAEAASTELIAEIIECDAEFPKSVTQRLFTGELSYTPSLPVIVASATVVSAAPTEAIPGDTGMDFGVDPNSF